MEKIRRVRRSAATWQKLFLRQARSGLSVPEFCSREKINAGVFRRWRSMLKDADQSGQIATAAQRGVEISAPFIDLGGIGMGGPRFEVRLDLGAGIVLSIARG